MSGDGQLRAFIERILRLKEEQDSLAADIREIYAEAKGNGFDKTAMGQLVSHLRKVEKVGADAVEEGQTVFDLYLSAYQRATGTPIATHTHEASQSYAEAKGRDAGSSSGRTAEFDSANAGSNPAPVTSTELTDTQEQPETANQSQRAGNTAKASVARVSQAESDSEEISAPLSPSPESTQAIADDEAAQANPIVVGALSNPQPNLLPGAVKAPEADSSPASGAALSHADVPAFLKPERRKTVADYRPECKHPDACWSSNPLDHCYTCRKAMEAASETEAA